jgi:hypothetical protein
MLSHSVPLNNPEEINKACHLTGLVIYFMTVRDELMYSAWKKFPAYNQLTRVQWDYLSCQFAINTHCSGYSILSKLFHVN